MVARLGGHPLTLVSDPAIDAPPPQRRLEDLGVMGAAGVRELAA
ncbi:MAG: hypothetical protein ACJ8J0_06360 [Longimicrobiaceae bacterium]